MRVANGKKSTAHDLAEVEKFRDYLQRLSRVDKNKPGSVELAYAETYGELVFEDKEALK